MQEQTGFQIHENEKLVQIPAGSATLEGILGLPEGAKGIVLFAHGSGSSRLSPRSNYLARALRDKGFGTLLMDLLMVDEAEDDGQSPDADAQAQRILIATDWLEQTSDAKNLRVGYFGSDTGAAAAVIAAARAGIEGAIPITGDPAPCAVVCRSGRTDLTGPYLPYVKVPTLLIAGGKDEQIIKLNEDALRQLTCEKAMEVIPGATRLFEEPGALEEAARLASGWFETYLNSCADSNS
jgi:predicted alpha/beta-hydrolase family hydrolase